MLAVDIEEGLSFGGESSTGDHLSSIKGLAHGYLLKVFYIGMEDEFIVMWGKDGPAEVLDLNHGGLLKIMPVDLTC